MLIPALSYLAGTLFQAGYNHYFGFPDEVVSTDPIATFHASRRYLDLVAHHFSPGIGIPLAFLVYVAALPATFYRAHAILVLSLTAVALFLSFSIHPFVWAAAATIALLLVQFLPFGKRGGIVPQLVDTSPTAVKALAVVGFFYATLFSGGYASARYQTEFFITAGSSRYVVLTISDKVAIALELRDQHCGRVTALPQRLEGYHFDRHVKAFTLGDADTPQFQLYETDGLKPSSACAIPAQRAGAWTDAIWI